MSGRRRPCEGALFADGKTIPFTVDYGKRKQLRIVVDAEKGVEVRAPLSTPFSVVTEAVERRAEWIAAALQRVRKAARAVPKPLYAQGEAHLFLGVPYPLDLRKGRGIGELSDGRLLLSLRGESPSGDEVKKALERWYSSQATSVFGASLERCLPRCASFVRSAPPLQARFLRASWGRWSSVRGVTLNTHLLKAPPDCIDYVLLHELCHIRHPNHGRAFYELLESVLPEWRERKKHLEATVRLRLFV